MKTIEQCCTQLLELIDKEGGILSINYDLERKEWAVRCEFGKEAEDSSMYGGAVYGVNEHLSTAVNEAVKELTR